MEGLLAFARVASQHLRSAARLVSLAEYSRSSSDKIVEAAEGGPVKAFEATVKTDIEAEPEDHGFAKYEIR